MNPKLYQRTLKIMDVRVNEAMEHYNGNKRCPNCRHTKDCPEHKEAYNKWNALWKYRAIHINTNGPDAIPQ